MSEHFFLLGRGHLPAKAGKIANFFGATLVNFTEPNGHKRHWFAAPNRGEPFDSLVSTEVRKALAAAGLFVEAR